MTTSNPEVVAWRWRKPVVNDQGETVGTTAWKLGDAPEFLPWWTHDPLIRLSDYEALQAEYAALAEALEAFMGIVSDSDGVAGYHLNGAVAEWDEFQAVYDATAALTAYHNGEEV